MVPQFDTSRQSHCTPPPPSRSLGAYLLLEQDELVLRAQEQAPRGPAPEQAVHHGRRRHDLLGRLVLQVLDEQVPVLVEDREPVASDEDRGADARAALALAAHVAGAVAQAEAATGAGVQEVSGGERSGREEGWFSCFTIGTLLFHRGLRIALVR